MNAAPTTLTVERLGRRGEGVARGPDGPVYIPYALANETVTADISGERGRLDVVVTPSPDRVAPSCKWFGACGGCAVQALAPAAYAAWKRGLVAAALARENVAANVGALAPAHGAGRRRVMFHARDTTVGFMRMRAHEIVAIDACPILAASLDNALTSARAIARTLAALGKPLDILVTATLSGLDVDIRGPGALGAAETLRLVAVAETHDLARLSNHGVALITRREPLLRMGAAMVAPPPGAFLQATEAAEDVIAAHATRAVAGGRAADLFAGVGTLALRLASAGPVHAVDASAPALAALARAAHAELTLKAVSTETRDLFRRPLGADELAGYDAVVFDPPRAGAEAQARLLAASDVPTVVAVSCEPASLARDAALLIAGGYTVESVTPIDQFLYSAHVETVAVFRKPRRTRSKRARLLG